MASTSRLLKASMARRIRSIPSCDIADSVFREGVPLSMQSSGGGKSGLASILSRISSATGSVFDHASLPRELSEPRGWVSIVALSQKTAESISCEKTSKWRLGRRRLGRTPPRVLLFLQRGYFKPFELCRPGFPHCCAGGRRGHHSVPADRS